MTPAEAILSAANAATGSEFPPDLIDAINAIGDLPEEERFAAQASLIQSLPEITSPSGAGMLAVWLGAGVERGADPQPAIAPMLATLLRWSREVATDADGGGAGPDGDLDTGMQMLGQGMVAHLSRAPEQIAEIQKRAEVVTELERAEPHSVGVTWVLELLRQQSGELVVLHATERAGFRLAYHNLSNCFHLFTLIQGALAGKMPGSRKASEETLAVARGELDQAASDDAWWHFGQADVPSADLSGMIFGEAGPDSIASIDGQQVLLLWPPVMGSRGWDGGFFGPILHARPPKVALLSPLAGPEVARWYTRLGLGSA